jgi:hypothetical protein
MSRALWQKYDAGAEVPQWRPVVRETQPMVNREPVKAGAMELDADRTTALWHLLRISVGTEGGTVVTMLSHRQSDAELRATFEYLSTKWREETAMEALQVRKAMNFAYQCIIGMGKDAVPFILESLSEEIDDWFWALTAIARENIADGTRTMAEAAQAWVEWGKAERYL